MAAKDASATSEHRGTKRFWLARSTHMIFFFAVALDAGWQLGGAAGADLGVFRRRTFRAW